MGKEKKMKDINALRRKNKKNMTVPGKTTRKPEMISDVPLNICLINCRSLKPKLNSLVESFKMNKLSFVLLNETWFYKSDPQTKNLLQEINREHGIQFIRKDRDSRGGGVAVAFDSNLMTMKKLNLETLKKERILRS